MTIEYTHETIEEFCRLLNDGDTWGALEVLRRETDDKGLAQTLAEAQTKAGFPW